MEVMGRNVRVEYKGKEKVTEKGARKRGLGDGGKVTYGESR